MPTIRVASWNAEGMFVEGSMTRRASPHSGLKTLKKLNADIVVIPEFGVKGKLNEMVRIAIQSLGYQIIEAPYDDPNIPTHVPDKYEMAILTRLPLRSHILHHFKMTNRVFVEAQIELPGHKRTLRVFGVHLDDRAEKYRLEQIKQLVALLNKPHVGETILLGDFNAMHKQSKFALIVRSRIAKAANDYLPNTLLRSVVERVQEMAIGTTIEYLLKYAPLYDLDGKHRRTISARQRGLEWVPHIRLAKIDWIVATRGIRAEHYQVFPDIGSDHRPVVADIIIS